MTREDFKRSLFESAKREAGLSKYVFSNEAELDLKRMIEAGVNRMTSADYSSRQGVVEQNLKVLVKHMINNARSRGLYENLDRRSFSAVSLSICPLWPFC